MKQSITGAVLVFMALACIAAPARAQDQTLPQEQLEQMLAPVALYPDELLSQVLIASTYPLEVVEADRWLKEHQGASPTDQSWDDSIKALAQTPDVLSMMSDNLDWTQNLGDAVLAQQGDVMNAVQSLRARAYAEKTLATTDQQLVQVEPSAGGGETIVIQSAAPNTVYVPYYEPAVVYGAWPYPSYPPVYYPPPPGYAVARGIAFGAGIAIASDIWNHGFDWNDRDIDVNINRNNTFNNIGIDRTKIGGNTRPGQNGGGTQWKHDPAHRHGVQYNDDRLKKEFTPQRKTPGDNAAEMRQQFRGHPGQPSGTLGTRQADFHQTNAGRQVQSRPNAAPAIRHASPAAARPASIHSDRGSAFSNVNTNRQAYAQSQRGRASLNAGGHAGARAVRRR